MLHLIVKRECDTPGRKKELERLAKFTAWVELGLKKCLKLTMEGY
jgi:hypothetical protein